MPAEANAMRDSGVIAQCGAAKTRATTVGMVLWNTIAPVMLPIARVSLRWRTQITLLNFSGSSVAIGAMTSASRASSTPSVWARCSTAPTNAYAPTMMHPRANRTWTLTIRRRGTAGRRGATDDRGGGTGAAARSSRSTGGVGLEVALDVPGVHADQHDRDDQLAASRDRSAGTPRRRPARRRSRSTARRGHHDPGRRSSGRRPARVAGRAMTATPVTNIASVASMNGAPRMAPTPTSVGPRPRRTGWR